MILPIALLIVIIITSLSVVFTRRRLSQLNFARWILPLGILILFAGILLIVFSANDITDSLVRQSWPVMMASIISTDIIGERAYSPQLSCEYKVDGKVYTLTTDLKTPGFGRKKTRRQTSEIILKDFPVGSKVQIKYNPANPAEAFIRTGPYWSDYMKISLGVLLSFLGLYGIVGILIKIIN
jgi:hypothetical protein